MGAYKTCPTSFHDADKLLAGRCYDGRKVANNTYLERRDGAIALRYHSTDVVTYRPDGALVLDSGGWHTLTTKERINWALPAGLHLRQDKGRWYIGRSWFDGGTPYADGMSIRMQGNTALMTGGGKETPKADREVKRKVKAFAQLCADSLPVPKPSGGDCWFCYMVTQDGQTLGDAFEGNDHLDSHIEEGYVVPSLVYHALKDKGCGDAYLCGAFGEAEYYLDIARREVKRAVYRYVLRRKGFAIT